MKSSCFGTLILLMLLVTTPVPAQPTMDQLWPNPDGLRLEYEYHWSDAITGQSMVSPAYLRLTGTVETAGGTAQYLLAGHDDLPPPPVGAAPPVGGFLGAVWRARPDLRTAIEHRITQTGKDAAETWNPYLLHDGYFLKTATAVEMWQPDWDHATWTYLQSDISVGASFTHQLIPELASDIFLHGTVGAIGATVITPLTVYDDAVRVDYLIDMGQGVLMDEEGNAIGTAHGEIRGHVHYVPGVGPVEMFEQFLPWETVDCGAGECPPGEWTGWVGQVVETESLAATAAPVPSEAVSWGEVKTLFR